MAKSETICDGCGQYESGCMCNELSKAECGQIEQIKGILQNHPTIKYMSRGGYSTSTGLDEVELNQIANQIYLLVRCKYLVERSKR